MDCREVSIHHKKSFYRPILQAFPTRDTLGSELGLIGSRDTILRLVRRSPQSAKAWLKEHPSVAVGRFDGSSEYASAIPKGAPQAQQVSDRWHLVKNLAACVSMQPARTLAHLRRADERRPARTPAIQHAQQARQAERMTRYEHILELQQHGMKSGEIARTLGMSQRTIQRWIAT